MDKNKKTKLIIKKAISPRLYIALPKPKTLLIKSIRKEK